MALIPATTQICRLALSQSVALIFIGLAYPVPGSAMRDPGAGAKVTVASQARDTSVEGDKIRRMIAKYAKSVDEADTTLASQIWSDSPEVSFIHPLGHEHGLEQIKQNVYRRLMGDTFSERKLNVHDISAHVYGDSAWAEFYWDFVAKFRKDGSPITTHGRETQVYRKEKGGWRLVHVHYSGMPTTEKPCAAFRCLGSIVGKPGSASDEIPTRQLGIRVAGWRDHVRVHVRPRSASPWSGDRTGSPARLPSARKSCLRDLALGQALGRPWFRLRPPINVPVLQIGSLSPYTLFEEGGISKTQDWSRKIGFTPAKPKGHVGDTDGKVVS